MPKPKKTNPFSQSMLEDWLACRQRFYLRYVAQIEWPDLQTDQLVEQRRRTQKGVAFHRIMQQIATDIAPEKINALELDPDMRRWWENFTQAAPLPADARFFPEITLTAGIDGHLFIAKCDLIVALPDGRIQIWDWKTTDKLPKRERMAGHAQTRLYRLMAALAGSALTGRPVQPEQVEMIYWFPHFPQNALRFSYSAEEMARDRQYFADLAGQIAPRQAEADFPKTDHLGACKFCQYRSLCDRGEQAGPLDEYDEIENGNPQFETDGWDEIEEIEI